MNLLCFGSSSNAAMARLTRALDRALAKPWTRRLVVTAFLAMTLSSTAHAEPFSYMLDQVEQLITGPVARAFTLIAIAYGGIQTAYGDGAHHKNLGRILLGGGLAMFATQVFAWLFM